MSEPVLQPDHQLTKNFSLYELTVTTNTALQEKNRIMSGEDLEKLRSLAVGLEDVRAELGVPIHVNSGRRIPELNGATAGSSKTSQHILCEAADLHPLGDLDLDHAFAILYLACKQKRLKFGQLIIEEANRDYGVARWIHFSVPGSLPKEKLGLVMKMVHGVYTVLEKID